MKFITNSFKGFNAIYDNFHAKFYHAVIVLVLICLFTSFPGSIAAIRNGGFSSENIANKYDATLPKWFPLNLPGNILSVGPGGLETKSSDITVLEDEHYTIVLNFPDGEDFKKSTHYSNKKVIYVLYTSYINCYDNGNVLNGSYNSFKEKMEWSSIRQDATGKELQALLYEINDAFRGYRILSAVGLTTLTNTLMNTALVLILAAMALLFRFGCQDFLKYRDLFKITVSSAIVPTTVSLIISLLLFAWFPAIGTLAQVINMWGIGIMVVLVMMKVARKRHTSATYGKEIR